MRQSTTLPILLATAGCVALPPSAMSQEISRKELRREDLSGAPGMEVILSLTELKPGDTVPAHFHHGIETGSPIMNLRNAQHGGFKVTGTKTIKLPTVHIVDKGKPLYDTSKK